MGGMSFSADLENCTVNNETGIARAFSSLTRAMQSVLTGRSVRWVRCRRPYQLPADRERSPSRCQGHMVDALAPGVDEGRERLR